MLILIGVLVLLAIAHVATVFIRTNFDYKNITGVSAFVRLFYWDTEGNVPTWYASTLLLLCSSLLALIAYNQKTNIKPYYWIGLAIIFLLLSLDESAAFHEHLNSPVRSLFNIEDTLYFAWVIPGSVFVLLVGIFCLKFIFQLPKDIRNLFLIASVLFVSGAIGLEIPGSYYYRLSGLSSTAFIALATIEEFLEMVGTLIFVYALLKYLERQTAQQGAN
jgi:hypothetical protein